MGFQTELENNEVVDENENSSDEEYMKNDKDNDESFDNDGEIHFPFFILHFIRTPMVSAIV